MAITRGEWDALDGELHLVRYLAHSGLTALRRADFQSTGSYFEAFFALTISLERAAKLVLAMDQRLSTGAFPTDAQLRHFGHGLVRLEAKVTEVVGARSLPLRFDPPSGALDIEVLAFLDDFANASKDRYYNLSYLDAARTGVAYDGPPAKWMTLVTSHLTAREIRLTPRELDGLRMETAIDGTGASLFRMSREDGTVMRSRAEGREHYHLNLRVQKRGTLACIHHLRYLMEALRCVANQGRALELPEVWDYFTLLLNDDSYLKTRKTFS